VAKMNMIVALKNAVLQQFVDKIDAGGAAGSMAFYTADMPNSASTAISTQTLIGTTALSYPCGTVADGLLTFSAITEDASADADGTVAFVRYKDSGGNAVLDLDVSTVGGTGFVQMNTTTVAKGGALRVSSATFGF